MSSTIKRRAARIISHDKIVLNPITIKIMHDGRLTVREAAKYIGCSLDSIYNHKDDKDWPPYIKINTRTYYYLDDLKKWIEERPKVNPEL